MVEWRDVVGWEGLYEVSSSGMIRSLDRLVKNGRGRRISRGRELVHRDNSTGYKFVSLYDANEGRSLCVYVHRVVAEAFLGTCPEGFEVDHVDTDKANNTVDNLRYLSGSDNISRAIDYVVGKPKLTVEQVRFIRYARNLYGTTYKQLAEMFNVSVRAIQKICKRENYRNIV